MVDHRSVDWSPPDLPTKAAKLCASRPSEAPSTLPPPTSIPSPSILSTSDRLLAPGQSGHLAIFTFCASSSFYPSRQYQNLQFNMYLYITTTLCQFLKIPQNQVEVHFNDLKKLQSPRFTSVFHVWHLKIINIKEPYPPGNWLEYKEGCVVPQDSSTFGHPVPSHQIMPSNILLASQVQLSTKQ